MNGTGMKLSIRFARLFRWGPLTRSGPSLDGSGRRTCGGLCAVLLVGMAVAAFGTSPSPAQTPPTSGLLYDVTFGGDTVNLPPSLHAAGAPAPRLAPTGLNGTPTVQSAHGTLLDQPVMLDGSNDSVHLTTIDFPGGVIADGLITLQADVFIGSGAASGAFNIFFFDENFAQTVRLEVLADGGLRILEGNSGISGSFTLDATVAVRVEIDLAADTYRVLLDGTPVIYSVFSTPPAQITQVTANMNSPSTMATAVDNIRMSITPGMPRTVRTVDLNIDAIPSIGATADGEGNPGVFWNSVSSTFPPVTLNAGDTITGTVVFNNGESLEVQDNGGGFYAVGSNTGNERFLVSLRGTGNVNEVRQHTSLLEFIGLTGAPVVNPVTRAGGFESAGGTVEFFTNIVDAGSSFRFTGFIYSYRMNRATRPLNLDNVVFRFGAENILQVAAPPLAPSPVVYDVDFNPDATDALPSTHPAFAQTPRTAVAGHDGDPTVVAAFGGLADQPLLFDGFDDVAQGVIRFDFDDLPVGSPADGLFVYSADVLVESDFAPAIGEYLEIKVQGAANALSVEFDNTGVVRVNRLTGPLVETMDTGAFPLDSRVRFRMEIDTALDSYKVIVNGVPLSSGSFDAPEILKSFAGIEPSPMRAAIDNIEISIGGTPTPVVKCPATDTELARIFADAGDGGVGAYIVTFNPETSDGGQKDLSGSGLCPGPSFPGDGSDPSVGYIKVCPDNDCFGPEGRPAFGAQFHHRVRASGSLCNIHCVTVGDATVCTDTCVESVLPGGSG